MKYYNIKRTSLFPINSYLSYIRHVKIKNSFHLFLMSIQSIYSEYIIIEHSIFRIQTYKTQCSILIGKLNPACFKSSMRCCIIILIKS